MLPTRWRSDRLLLRDARLDDVDRLLALFNANSFVAPWDPTFRAIERPEMERLVEASLAGFSPKGKPFQLQCFCAGPPDQIAGYYHMTFGAPEIDTIWISMFVIDPGLQRHKYGSEAIAGVNAHFHRLGRFRAAWAQVWLKNWPALRFWTRAGYNRVVSIEGDAVYAPDTQASVILEFEVR